MNVPLRILILLVLVSAMAIGLWIYIPRPMLIPLIIYTAVSPIAFGVYAWDKTRSKKEGAFRISEMELHFWEAIGGWPGALIASKVLRHKTQSKGFCRIRLAIVITHIVLLCVYTGWLLGRG